MPDGSKIGWAHAWKRSSVDIVLAIVSVTVTIWTLTQVEPNTYISLPWIERVELLQAYQPVWYHSFNILVDVWIWSELVVLLLNERKRAIHDYIAGTVVVMKEFAKTG